MDWVKKVIHVKDTKDPDKTVIVDNQESAILLGFPLEFVLYTAFIIVLTLWIGSTDACRRRVDTVIQQVPVPSVLTPQAPQAK